MFQEVPLRARTLAVNIYLRSNCRMKNVQPEDARVAKKQTIETKAIALCPHALLSV